MNIEHLLHVEIEEELTELKKMQVGSDQYKTAVDGVSKLFDRAIELEKLDIEHQEKIKDREIDRELKLKQMSEERKDRSFKNGIAIGTFVIYYVVSKILTKKIRKIDMVTSLKGNE